MVQTQEERMAGILDQIKKLKLKRGSMKAQLTHLEKYVVDFNLEDNGAEFNLSSRITRLKEVGRNYEENHYSLIELAIEKEDDDMINLFESEANEFHTKLINIEFRYIEKLEFLEGIKNKEKVEISSRSSAVIINEEKSEVSVNNLGDCTRAEKTELKPNNETKLLMSDGIVETDIIKLPSLKLPAFSGNFDEWISFKKTCGKLW